jgi:hypothetical protein
MWVVNTVSEVEDIKYSTENINQFHIYDLLSSPVMFPAFGYHMCLQGYKAFVICRSIPGLELS